MKSVQRKLSHSLLLWILFCGIIGTGGTVIFTLSYKYKFTTSTFIINILCFIVIGCLYGLYFQFKNKLWSLIPQKLKLIISIIMWLIGFSIFSYGITASVRNHIDYVIPIILLGIAITQCSTTYANPTNKVKKQATNKSIISWIIVIVLVVVVGIFLYKYK